MNLCVLLLLLHLSTVNPIVDVEFTDITTIEQGLTELNRAFPDWRQNYKEGEFDCSEMSALVYQYFKCCGLEPELKVGYNFNEGWAHAWVVCQGEIIESTWLDINPDKEFYNQIAPCSLTEEAQVTEYDWWNSPYIKNFSK